MGKNQARYGSGSGKGIRMPDEFAKRSDESAATHVKGHGQKTLWLKSHVHNDQKNDYRSAIHAGKRRQNPMMGATRIKGKGNGQLTGIGKGDFAIPASQVSAGGKAGIKALKSTGREIETSLWNKVGAKPRTVNLNQPKQMVGKAIPSSFLEAGRELTEGVKEGKGLTQALPGAKKSVLRSTGNFIGAKPLQSAGIAAGTAAGTTALIKRDIAKRGRYYDPEANRNNRQGMYQGAGALGGGMLAASGIKDIVHNNRGEGEKFDTTHLGMREQMKAGGYYKDGRARELTPGQRKALESAMHKGKGVRVRGLHASKVALGAAGIGAAAGFRQHSLSERNRSYN